jgi:hypothetical protein
MTRFCALIEIHGRVECKKPPQRDYEIGGMKVPRLQILTAAQILDNRRPQVPFGFTEGFKKAGREEASQDRLL